MLSLLALGPKPKPKPGIPPPDPNWLTQYVGHLPAFQTRPDATATSWLAPHLAPHLAQHGVVEPQPGFKPAPVTGGVPGAVLGLYEGLDSFGRSLRDPAKAAQAVVDNTPVIGGLAGIKRAIDHGSVAEGLAALPMFLPGGAAEEKVVAAAVKHAKSGRVFTGGIHVIARQAAAEAGAGGKMVDGFLTNTGRFLNREEAQQLAGRSSSEQFAPGALLSEAREVPKGWDAAASQRSAMFGRLRAEHPDWNVRQIADSFS